MGKTALVSAAQADLGGVATEPVPVRSSPGSLQRALLQAVAAGVRQVEDDEGPVSRAVRLAEAVATRMAEQGLSDLASAVGGVIRHQVGKHLGADALKAGEKALSALKESEAHELRRRIAATGDADVLEVVLAFAAELAAMADEVVTLALDDVHRLDDDDHRRLLDLTDIAPDRVRVRASFTQSPGAGDRLAGLRANGAAVIELGPLDLPAVSEWAAAIGLDHNVVVPVAAITGGVPFHVKDAFALIVLFGEFDLSRLARDDVVRHRTGEAWSALSGPDQRATALLAPLAEEISAERAAHILGIELTDWFIVRKRLVEAGLFLADTQWFHELRRLCVLEDVLDPDQRADAARVIVARDIELLDARPDGEADLLGCIRDLGRMPDAARSVLADRAGVAAVLDLSADELRTLTTIIELSDRPDPAGSANPDEIVAADLVVGHLARLSPPIDAVSIIATLKEAGLIGMIEARERLGVWPSFPSAAAWWVAEGRAVVELGRWPLRGLASVLFDVALRPALQDFHRANRGIGRPGLGALADAGKRLQMEPRGDRGVLVSDRWPTVVVRARYADDVPLYAIVAFDRFSDREAAIGRLRDLGSFEIMGSALVVDELYGFPGYAQPLHRFESAYEGALRAAGTRLDGERFDLAEGARRVKAFHDLVRRNTAHGERDALGVIDPIGVRYATSGDGFLFVVVENDDEVSELTPEKVRWPTSAQEWLTLDQELGLKLGQHHAHIHLGGGAGFQGDPLRDLLGRIAQRSETFNRAQLRVQVDYTIGALAPLLSAAHSERSRLMAEISAEVLGVSYTPEDVFVALQPTEPEGGWVPGAIDSVVCWSAPAAGETPVLRLAEGAPPWSFDGAPSDEFRTLFGQDPPETRTSLVTTAVDWITDMLGHDNGRVWLHWPGHRPLPRPEDDPW